VPLNRLFGRLFSATKVEMPTFYPHLNPLQLEQFLTVEEYTRIKSFDNFYILPFVTQNGEARQTCFGLGLSRLMIRNAMLLRDVSIHGPEDTPEVPHEAIRDIAKAQPRSSHITGVANLGPEGYSLHVEVHRRSGPVNSARVQQKDFRTFLRTCSTAIAQLLGSRIDADITQKWDVGQPRTPESLIQLGRIHLNYERQQIAERGQAAESLLQADPNFVVAMWDVDEEYPGAKETFLTGLVRDPHNAQLCFTTFCAVWVSRGPQPEALQFCRKAIELSPGHGKAHMCAPHAAQRPAEMLNHSELGYRLLPGNSFAVNNYTLALNRANAPAERRIELAQEGIAMDPRDPGNYQRLIELYTELGDFKTALATAEALQLLFEPTIDERALYCLRQNPYMAKLLDSGQHDPAADNRQRIAELRARI